MASQHEKHAAAIGCPFTDGTNSNVKEFTMDTTSKSNELPKAWAGRMITVRPFGGNIWVHFSKDQGRTVDRTVAAADAGSTNAAAAKFIGSGEERHFELPQLAIDIVTAAGTKPMLFFNRQSDTASSSSVYVEVALADGTGAPV